MANTFVFNDELLLRCDDVMAVKAKYPTVAFAFYTTPLRESFPTINAEADGMKRKFRKSGLWAVALGTIGLWLATIEPIYLTSAASSAHLHGVTSSIVAVAAAGFGVLSVLIGFSGLLVGPFSIGTLGTKRRWLQLRLVGERLRQWQWQYFFTHLPEIIEAVPSQEKQAAYIKLRDEAFSTFLVELLNTQSDRLDQQVQADFDPSISLDWIHPEFAARAAKLGRLEETLTKGAGENQPSSIQELLSGYQEIRLKGQIDYVTYMTKPGPLGTHAITQKKWIGILSSCILVLIVLLHLGILAAVIAEIPAMKGPIVHVLIVVLAIAALALRVIEEGLRPTEQIARLRLYLREILSARQRFQENSMLAKVTAMRTLEEAAAREMREFLQSANKSRYII